MELAKVIGSLWSTQKDQNLKGLKMLMIHPVNSKNEQIGSPLVATDTVGAGFNDIVFYITASEAVIPIDKEMALTDASIIGIVDKIGK